MTDGQPDEPVLQVSFLKDKYKKLGYSITLNYHSFANDRNVGFSNSLRRSIYLYQLQVDITDATKTYFDHKNENFLDFIQLQWKKPESKVKQKWIVFYCKAVSCVTFREARQRFLNFFSYTAEPSYFELLGENENYLVRNRQQ